MTSRVPGRHGALLLSLLMLIAVLVAALVASPAPSVVLGTPTPTPTEPTLRPVRIVVSVALSGARAAQSTGVANAMRIAVDATNGRVVGRDAAFAIELVVLDSSGPSGAWSEEKERANLARAIADPSVVAYIGLSTNDAARVAAPLAAGAKLALIAPTLTVPSLTKRGFDDGFFAAVHPNGQTVIARTIPSDDVGAAALVGVIAKERGTVSVSVATIEDGSTFGAIVAKAFREAAQAAHLEVREANDPAVRFVYLAGADAATLATRAKALCDGGRALAFGGPETLLADAFLAQGGCATRGALATFVGRPFERYAGAAAAFLSAYGNRYSSAPDPYAIYGYEAGLLVIDALHRTFARPGVDRGAVRDAIFATKSFDGALGTWGFDASGDTTLRAVQLYEVRAIPGGTLGWTWNREVTP